MVSIVSDTFSDIGFTLTTDKCEFLPWYCTTTTPLHSNNVTIPLVDCIRWLGISITNNFSRLRQRTVCDIKQFVVTNCSKEQTKTLIIVTKTLNSNQNSKKNGILIPIVTSKELHFNVDFKYMSQV